MNPRSIFIGLSLFALFALSPAFALEPEKYQKEQDKAQEWFQDAKFGLFVHWGVYSLLGKGEWVMNNDKMTVEEYEKLYPHFNPTEFDADEWVKMAKDAGMNYITITSKHHDGFCMFDSKLTHYDIMNTVFGRDVMKELADACKRRGMKIFFYYSQLDWHHPDYYPRGRTGNHTGRPDEGDWTKYLEYYQGHMRELCTNYGKIGGIWFDGLWDKKDAFWNNAGIYNLIHSLQPQALIGSNHHMEPFHGEGFQMFEQDLPGENTAGFNKAGISSLPLETCLTMNNSWGYNKNDKNFKSVEEIIHYLVKAAGFGANLLLNVGPMPNGEIQPEFTERLKEVGDWMKKYGGSIYRTRRGPYVKQDWGTSTASKDRKTVYLHILDWPEQNKLELPKAGFEINAAKIYRGTGRLDITEEEDQYILDLSNLEQEEIDTIVEFKINILK